jgi:hypothetical protein
MFTSPFRRGRGRPPVKTVFVSPSGSKPQPSSCDLIRTVTAGVTNLQGLTHQPGFAQAEFAAQKKVTRREQFLARRAALLPWARLLAVLAPFYPQGERARPPVGLERSRRMYFLQPWYGLADEALEDALDDRQALRGFARMELADEGVPDATTPLKFRRRLETHELCKGRFTAINPDPAARGRTLRAGTLVDATLIEAPPATQKPGKATRPGKASDPPRQPMVFRNESTPWRGSGQPANFLLLLIFPRFGQSIISRQIELKILGWLPTILPTEHG